METEPLQEPPPPEGVKKGVKHRETFEAVSLPELPIDVLETVLDYIDDAATLGGLAQTSRALRTLAGPNCPAWKALCVRRWGLAMKEPTGIPCLEDEALGLVQQYPEEVRLIIGKRSKLQKSANGRRTWRDVYCDRARGWQLVRTSIWWLAGQGGQPLQRCGGAHFHSMEQQHQHIFLLHIALRYLVLLTAHSVGDESGVRHSFKESGAISAIMDLLAIENCTAVLELAAAALANLCYKDSGVKSDVLAAGGQRLLGRLLAQRKSVQREAARALVTLLSHQTIPEVDVLDVTMPAKKPCITSGQWLCEEFHSSGERGDCIEIDVTLHHDGHLVGWGVDAVGMFTLHAEVDPSKNDWYFEKNYHGGPTLHFQGYGDSHGVWGVYCPLDRARWLPSHMRQLARRVFRMWPAVN